MTENLGRVLKVTTLQAFLQMSDDDMEKAKSSGPRMANMITALWSSIRELVDARNKEAAEVDRLKEEMAEEAYGPE